MLNRKNGTALRLYTTNSLANAYWIFNDFNPEVEKEANSTYYKINNIATILHKDKDIFFNFAYLF